MVMDFSKLSVPTSSAAPTDPFKIFAGLPRVHGAPNDLWRGQADALAAWHNVRKACDIHVGLNTGAGKTVVGLLIAKSLVNEGIDNVLYVCPTTDLVIQTANQAKIIGLDVSLRHGKEFNNDLFESGKTFCITNYSSVFNGHSALRRKHFPGAIIFDDAHVAESIMRDSFTISLNPKDHAGIISDLARIFLPYFVELDREIQFKESFDTGLRIPQSALVPPSVVIATLGQIKAVMQNHAVGKDPQLTFPYEHLKDRLDRCAILFRGGKCEITPPFLPSLGLDIFQQRVRRIYLSATLQNKADIVRAFGRTPDHIIEPSNDAGNGERLIIFNRELQDTIDAKSLRKIAAKHKAVVAVPSYQAANAWAELAVPAKPDEFTLRLDHFRKTASGVFVLVSRVDGIDLPNDTCRLMVIEGVPESAGLLERYQSEFLHMRSFFASRVANRLVQLFGRINRGRSDYGAFLIAGKDLNIWMNNDKNVALLPKLLQNQIMLGRQVQLQMKITTMAAVGDLLDTVLLSNPRDAGWLEFYTKFLEANEVSAEATERAKVLEEKYLAAAVAEAKFAEASWRGNFAEARLALEGVVADTARADEKLAGWHNLWIGSCYDHEGDGEEARYYYSRARSQLTPNLIVPSRSLAVGESTAISRGPFYDRIMGMISLGTESYHRERAKLEKALDMLAGGTPKQMEESVRVLGDALGFEASRPDNDVGTGPDVLWIDTVSKVALGLELKTDKNTPYNKDEVGQSLDHANWVVGEYPTDKFLGIVMVGPDLGVTDKANPGTGLFSIKSDQLQQISNKMLAVITDARNMPPNKRTAFLDQTILNGWSLMDFGRSLCEKALNS